MKEAERETGRMKVSLFVNGKARAFEIAPGERLAHTLRENGYVSVKTGCGQGACGLCVVWADGKPVPSCSVPTARMEGKQITTLEGVEREAAEYGRLLVGEGADQCGYCAPGLVMLVLAMKRELRNPTEEEIKAYLNGNLCRCSGYYGQLRAAAKYLRGGNA